MRSTIRVVVESDFALATGITLIVLSFLHLSAKMTLGGGNEGVSSEEEEEEDDDAEQGFDSAEERAKVWWNAACSMTLGPGAGWSLVLQS